MKKTLKTILGKKNKIYYQFKFEQFDKARAAEPRRREYLESSWRPNKPRPSGITASWNWPAFFASWIWALYRKMYGWSFVMFGVTFFSVMLFEMQMFEWSIFALIVPCVVFAVSANALYHENLKKKIKVAKMTIQDKEDLIEYLNYIGGVNSWVVWVFGVGVPGLMLLAIIIPMLDS